MIVKLSYNFWGGIFLKFLNPPSSFVIGYSIKLKNFVLRKIVIKVREGGGGIKSARNSHSPLSLRSMYSAACNRAAMLIFPRFGVILAASVRARSPFFCRTLPRQHTCRGCTHGRTQPHAQHRRTDAHTPTRTQKARARTGAYDERAGENEGGGRGVPARYVIVMSSAAAPRRAASGDSAARRLPSAA